MEEDLNELKVIGLRNEKLSPWRESYLDIDRQF